MSNFEDVDIKYINFVFNTYELSGNKYLSVWNFLLKNNGIQIPIPIADFIIAFNNINKLRKYMLSELLTGNIFIDGISDIKRIIRILKYANKLEDDTSYFGMLPDDALFEIISRLNFETILNFCNVSKHFENLCKDRLLNILQISLKEQTGFNTDNFTLKQLYILSRNNKLQKHIVTYSDTYIINKKGEICWIPSGLFDNGPIILDTKLDINKIVAGIGFVIILDKNGKVYFMSKNNVLLDPTSVNIYMEINNMIITEVKGINNAVDAVAAYKAVFVLLDDGNVVRFGQTPNMSTTIGDQIINIPANKIYIPDLLPYFRRIRYMEYGHDDIYVVTGDTIRSIYAKKEYKVPNIIKIQEYGVNFFVLNSDGEVLLVKDDQITKVLDNVIDISSFFNKNRILFLSRNGDVYVYGTFDKTTFNVPTKLDKISNIVHIYCAFTFICLVDKDYNFYMNHIDENGKYNLTIDTINKYPKL
jgi:hypothetical protein